MNTLGSINVPEKTVTALGLWEKVVPIEALGLLQLLPSNKDITEYEHLVSSNLDTKLGDLISRYS
jgi:hypothetical protein